MPTATEAQVPKPLTYTLMYHVLWFVMFLLSAASLALLLLASGWGAGRSLLAALPLLGLALIAGLGALATYAIRVQLLLGEVDWAQAFRWSEASSWAVIVVAPLVWGAWVLLEPAAQRLWNHGQPWAVPEAIASAMFKVEIVIWWLSHLLSIRGLARGRRKYLAPSQPDAGAGAS
jgi:hypothetical protein